MAASIPETDPGLDQLTAYRYSPLMWIRERLVCFTRGIFNAAPVGCFHWSPEPLQSEIFITDEDVLEPDTMNLRPAISFTRSPVAFKSIGQGDVANTDFATGKTTKECTIPGTMVANCISRVSLEAEAIAFNVAKYTWLLRHLLMQSGFFDIGREPQIGSVSPAGSLIAGDSALGDQYRVVPVSISYIISYSASYTPLNQLVVQRIQQMLTVNPSGPINGLGAPLDPPFMNVHECPPDPFSPASDVYGRTPDPGGMRGTSMLPKLRHPLDPSKTVVLRQVYPNRVGASGPARVVPLVDPCVKESEE